MSPSLVALAAPVRGEALVNRGDFRPALVAAQQHAPRDPDEVTSRVRLILTFDTVRDLDDPEQTTIRPVLLVSSCDGRTAGVARCEVEGHADDVLAGGELFEVDLGLDVVADVLAVFKPPTGRDDRAAWSAESFRLTVTDTELTIEEAGAFVDGKRLVVPLLAAPAHEADGRSAYPDVARVLSEFLGRESVDVAHTINPQYAARLVAAGKAYGVAELVWRHVPGAVLVYIGRRYLALALVVVPPITRRHRHAEWGRGWVEQLEPLRKTLPDVLPLATVSPIGGPS